MTSKTSDPDLLEKFITGGKRNVKVEVITYHLEIKAQCTRWKGLDQKRPKTHS